MVAKPMVAALLTLVVLGAAACSSVASQEAIRQSQPELAGQVDQAVQASTDPAPSTQHAPAEPASANESSTADSDESNPSATDDRGSRGGADQEPVASGAQTTAATSEPGVTADPTATPDSAPAEQTEPAATPVATTEPVPLPDPTPTATAVPTAAVTVAPPTTQDPDPAFTAPAPTGPVPSDDIVVQGPDVDESEPVIISDAGASTCALTESAIEFLDLGDLTRTAAVLQEASQLAGQAQESEIAGMASQLADAGADEDAAIAAVIATLNACAIHGYQV